MDNLSLTALGTVVSQYRTSVLSLLPTVDEESFLEASASRRLVPPYYIGIVMRESSFASDRSPSMN